MPDGDRMHLAESFEGARLAVTAQRVALLRAAKELERVAYVLRDQASLGHEAGKAMEASREAFRAAGVDE